MSRRRHGWIPLSNSFFTFLATCNWSRISEKPASATATAPLPELGNMRIREWKPEST